MDIEFRAIDPDEYDLMMTALGRVFGWDHDPTDSRFRELLPLDRTRCGFEGDRIVATSGAFSLEMTVPGGVVPCGGTTIVSVLPTHRRQGVMRAMMAAHLEDVRDHKEPLAALWASDSAIYGRFGYGMASRSVDIEIDRQSTAFHRLAPIPAPARLVELDEAKPLVKRLYDEVRATTPGFFVRTDPWWEHRRFRDDEKSRAGASADRWVVVGAGDDIDGYVQFRFKSSWEAGHGAGELIIRDLLAATPEAESGLWSLVLNHDLTARITAHNRPTDGPVFSLLAGVRRARAELSDNLWVRIMDLPAALEGRRYSSPANLVFEVHDPLDGSVAAYRLQTDAEEVSCQPTTDDPDISLDLEDLSGCYMGRSNFRALARAGRVAGHPSPLTTADLAFSWDPQPWCPEVF